jgi:hypothetical protein
MKKLKALLQRVVRLGYPQQIPDNSFVSINGNGPDWGTPQRRMLLAQAGVDVRRRSLGKGRVLCSSRVWENDFFRSSGRLWCVFPGFI